MKKMKLETIVITMSQRGEKGSLLERAFNSITDFKTKVQLMSAYKEVREIYAEFDKERKKKLDALADQYCRENNMTREELGSQLPKELMPEYQRQLSELLLTEIEIKNKPEFDLFQLEQSDLTVPELVELEPFLKHENNNKE